MRKIIISFLILTGLWVGIQSLGSALNEDRRFARESFGAPPPTIQSLVDQRGERTETAAARLRGEPEDASDLQGVAGEIRDEISIEGDNIRFDLPVVIPLSQEAEKGQHYLVQDATHISGDVPLIGAGFASDVFYQAMESGSFEYGHFIRTRRIGARNHLRPAVRVWSTEYPDGFLILEDAFERSIEIARGGIDIFNPALMPWSGIPFWNARMDILVAAQQIPELRTEQALVEAAVHPFSATCNIIGFRPGNVSVSGMFNSAAAAFTGANTDEDILLTSDGAHQINMAYRSVFESLPEQINVPDIVAVPVKITADASSSISKIEPFFSNPTAAPYRCRPHPLSERAKGSTENIRSNIQHGIVNASGTPVGTYGPGEGWSIPIPPLRISGASYGYLIMGSPRVSTAPRALPMRIDGQIIMRDIHTVIWSPIRLDVIEGSYFNIGGAYVGSYDFEEERLFRLSRKMMGGTLIETHEPFLDINTLLE